MVNTIGSIEGLAARIVAMVRVWWPALPVLALWGLAGCGGLDPVSPYDGTVTDPAKLYMKLTLDHPALNLALSSPTWQLTAIPRNALGEPIEGLPAPTFRSTDTTAVRVSATGELTALKVATGVQIIAEVAASGNVRHADTALVNVANPPSPPILASLSIHPVPPDSAVWHLPGSTIDEGDLSALISILPVFFPLTGWEQDPPQLVPQVLSVTDAPVTGLAVEFVSLDPLVAKVDRWNGTVILLRPGTVRLMARTTAYGVTVVDTVAFAVTLPVFGQFAAETNVNGNAAIAPLGASVTIRPGGVVFWSNFLNTPADVTFDDPTAAGPGPDFMCFFFGFAASSAIIDPTFECGTGNFVVPAKPGLPDDPAWFLRMRQFTAPGVYTYHSEQTGTIGKIIVSADGLTP